MLNTAVIDFAVGATRDDLMMPELSESSLACVQGGVEKVKPLIEESAVVTFGAIRRLDYM